jgi:S1-C subfamily serine protease
LLESLEAGNDQVNIGWSIVAGDGPTATEAGLDDEYAGSVLVLGVTKGSPADTAEPDGVTFGDAIFTLNGSKVRNVPQVCKILESASPGDTIDVEEAYIGDSGFTPYNLTIKIPENQQAMTNTPTTSSTTSSTTSTTTP